MKYISTFIFPLFVSMVCIGQNHFFDRFEDQMNENYGYDGPPAIEACKGAFNILHNKFGQKNKNRVTCFKTWNWPYVVNKFIRVEFDNVPLLNVPDLKSDSLKVIGFTKVGELLEFVEHKQIWVTIVRPGGWRLQSWGDWYQVKTLNGENAWLFAKPYGVYDPFITILEKVIPKAEDSDKSDFPTGIIITVIVIFGLIVLLIVSLDTSPASTSNYDPPSYSSSSSTSESSSYDSDYTPSYESEYSSYNGDNTDDEENNSSYNNDTNDEEKRENGIRQCPDCHSIDLSSVFAQTRGDGKCSECRGTGLGDSFDQFNANLVNEKSVCEVCYGTKQCQTCGGEGIVYN